MDITITPKKLSGKIRAIPSKSQAHRLLICAALSTRTTKLYCPQTNEDIEATADCLRSLGASISYDNNCYTVIPNNHRPSAAELHCRESGSTLRFLLPIVGALGIDTTFVLEGRLSQRPLSPLWEEMEKHGCILDRPTNTTVRCAGKLQPGNYCIDGSVSSQFITGLLFAMSLMPGNSTLTITGKLESKPYVDMTLCALSMFGISTDNLSISGTPGFRTPGEIAVEGDWSNSAFFLSATAMGNTVIVNGLNNDSAQGDRAIMDILEKWNSLKEIDVSDIPDLVPILAVVAGARNGMIFKNIQRLRLKESDRVATVCEMINSLGAQAIASEDILCVTPGQYHSCIVNAAGDHRIAMAAAIAATAANGNVTILGAECVKKSYPAFWEHYKLLGGQYEQHIR